MMFFRNTMKAFLLLCQMIWRLVDLAIMFAAAKVVVAATGHVINVARMETPGFWTIAGAIGVVVLILVGLIAKAFKIWFQYWINRKGVKEKIDTARECMQFAFIIIFILLVMFAVYGGCCWLRWSYQQIMQISVIKNHFLLVLNTLGAFTFVIAILVALLADALTMYGRNFRKTKRMNDEKKHQKEEPKNPENDQTST